MALLTNSLTILRLTLLPVVIYSLLQDSWGYALIALISFLVMMLGEYLDRRLSRGERVKEQSFLSPFYDKVVLFSLLIIFFAQGVFWLFPLLIFFLRDFVVNGVRSIGARYDVALLEDNFGKVQTFFIWAMLFFLVLKHFLLHDGQAETELMAGLDLAISIFTILAMLLAVLSIISSSYHCWKAVREKKKEGQELKEEGILVLANQKSRGYRDGLRRRLLRLFVKRKKAELVYVSPEEGMYDKVKAKIKKYSQIVIAGGDGSFESALNFAPFKKKVLGFFPLGAGNAFYSYFYSGKGFDYLKSHDSFRESELDVLEIEWEKGKRQTLFLSLGFDAEVIRLTKMRTVNGFIDYLEGVWKSLLRARGDYDFNFTVDGKKSSWENCVNLVLGKVPYYGYSIRSIINSSPHDGFVYGQGIVNHSSPLFNKALRGWCMILTQLRMEYPPLVPLHGKEIEIRSEVPFPIQAGGEFLGYSHSLKVRVVRKQRVLVI